jgi:outer membrane protein assembly factor BamB
MVVTSTRFQITLGAAIVAGGFSLAVLGGMIINHWKALGARPLNTPELAALKATLQERPTDSALKEQIRDLDLRLRREFFRRQRISRAGSFLFAGGIAVLLAAAGAARAARPTVPQPAPDTGRWTDWMRAAKISRLSLAALGAVLGGVALAVISFPEPNLQAALAPTEPRPMPVAGGSPPPPSYPSWEEMEMNWPSFRGPGGLGRADRTNLPTAWNGATGEGVLWKAAVGLEGRSSPIVWKNRVFVTGANEKERKVCGFDADSGALLWEQTVASVSPAGGEEPTVTADAGYAASTPATDGRRVYAIFANGDLVAFNFRGERVWAKALGVPENHYGHASSLAVWRDRLIVQFDQATESKLLAFDGATGDTIWKADRPAGPSWTSPSVIYREGGDQIVVSATPWVIAYDPSDGVEIWRADCMYGETAPSPTYADGVAYAVNQGACLAAVRVDGTGDVTASHITWKAQDNLPDICSPVTDGQRVFLLTTSGTLTAFDVKDGRKAWEKDLEMSFYASPIAVGCLMYLLAERGTAIIVEPGAEYVERGRAELGEKVHATPAVVDGRIYVRAEKNLYCIGKKSP